LFHQDQPLLRTLIILRITCVKNVSSPEPARFGTVDALKTIVIHGKKLRLRVPPGIDTGMRLSSQGEALTKGQRGEPRDLYAVFW